VQIVGDNTCESDAAEALADIQGMLAIGNFRLCESGQAAGLFSSRQVTG
jgi:hypothetical protein